MTARMRAEKVALTGEAVIPDASQTRAGIQYG